LSDPTFIKAEIMRDRNTFTIRELGFDKWAATYICAEMNAQGLSCIEVQQSASALTAPCKEILGMINRKELVHFGNPILAWMASNVLLSEDPRHGGITAQKVNPPDSKVDGIQALANAVHRMMAAPPPISRGIFVLDLNTPWKGN
jgi:phage terminase large subunit-like protein